jgi:hypothetical protein
MKILLILFCFISLATPSVCTAEEKREIRELRFHDRKGKLLEVIRYYVDAKGKNIRHGTSIKYVRNGTDESDYVDGKQTTIRIHRSGSPHDLILEDE